MNTIPQNALSILLVEDNGKDAELMVRAMAEALPKSRVIVVGTFSDATVALAEKDIDLILLDLTLPDLSGERLVEEVRKLTDVPIIISTGDAMMETARMVARAGANSYLIKGEHSAIELRRLITMQLGRRECEVKKLKMQKTETDDCLASAFENIENLKRSLGMNGYGHA